MNHKSLLIKEKHACKGNPLLILFLWQFRLLGNFYDELIIQSPIFSKTNIFKTGWVFE